MAGREKPVLIIKHGALGDFILSFPAFAAIRRHHAGARVVLLTTPPFAGMARQSDWFDEVWTDQRGHAPAALFGLARRIRNAGFARIYDLQMTARTTHYFRWFFLGRKRPEWSGIAPGCSHPDRNPERARLHALERMQRQLEQAGIRVEGLPDTSFLQADISRFSLPEPFVLLVPGGARHRPEKRWPEEHFTTLAVMSAANGLTPVLLGAGDEAATLERIAAACPEAVNLCGRTDFADLASLARGARWAVGNDTGPMHLLAASGCPALTLFSAASSPARARPRGPCTAVLQCDPLVTLAPEKVWRSIPGAPGGKA